MNDPYWKPTTFEAIVAEVEMVHKRRAPKRARRQSRMPCPSCGGLMSHDQLEPLVGHPNAVQISNRAWTCPRCSTELELR